MHKSIFFSNDIEKQIRTIVQNPIVLDNPLFLPGTFINYVFLPNGFFSYKKERYFIDYDYKSYLEFSGVSSKKNTLYFHNIKSPLQIKNSSSAHPHIFSYLKAYYSNLPNLKFQDFEFSATQKLVDSRVESNLTIYTTITLFGFFFYVLLVHLFNLQMPTAWVLFTLSAITITLPLSRVVKRYEESREPKFKIISKKDKFTLQYSDGEISEHLWSNFGVIFKGIPNQIDLLDNEKDAPHDFIYNVATFSFAPLNFDNKKAFSFIENNIAASRQQSKF